MKRSLSNSSNKSNSGSIPISADGTVTESDLNSEMFLKLQNQQLARSAKRFKAEISEYKRELLEAKRQSKDMESLVSIIQRSWSQLDFDGTLLLNEMDGSSSSSSLQGGSAKFSFLESLLSAGDRYLRSDATSLEKLPVLGVDEWTAVNDIEIERKKTIDQLKAQLGKSNSDNNTKKVNEHEKERGVDNDMDEEDDSEGDDLECVKESLKSHTEFTLSLLSRICQSKVGEMNISEGSLTSIAKAKELHSQNSYYVDRISKLSSTIISLKAAVFEGRKQMQTAERSLVKLQEELDVQKSSSSSNSNSNSNYSNSNNSNSSTTNNPSRSSSASIDTNTCSAPSQNMDTSDSSILVHGGSKSQSNSDEIAEIQTRLSVLQQQLSDSEVLRAQLEINLTNALAGNLKSINPDNSDSSNTATEKVTIRSLYEGRMSSLESENSSLSEKVTSLESNLYKIEDDSKSKFEKIVASASNEIESLKAENASLKRDMNSFKGQLAQLNQLQTLVEDFHFIEKSLKQETTKLQDRIKILNSDIERLNTSVSSSRSREATLESSIVSSSATDSVEIMIKQSQERMAEYEAESQALNASLNDMILEIDSISSGDSKLRQDFARLLLQLKDSQKEASESMSQCVKLKDELADLKKAATDAEAKSAKLESIFRKQDGIINQLKSVEQACRSELNESRAIHREAADKLSVNEILVAETQQKMMDVETELKHSKDRCNDLRTRCQEITKKYEGERKLRHAVQREGGKKRDKEGKVGEGGETTPRDSSSSSGGSKGSDDMVEMLDMTLGMLRCSVCRDRFKEVAINRCFHLFCRQCIDNCLKSRQRKCPACGEKFGQDDVKTIYFTN